MEFAINFCVGFLLAFYFYRSGWLRGYKEGAQKTADFAADHNIKLLIALGVEPEEAEEAMERVMQEEAQKRYREGDVRELERWWSKSK